jgi:hypothetical protein
MENNIWPVDPGKQKIDIAEYYGVRSKIGYTQAGLVEGLTNTYSHTHKIMSVLNVVLRDYYKIFF